MSHIEKILSDIVRHMKDDDIAEADSGNKSVHQNQTKAKYTANVNGYVPNTHLNLNEEKLNVNGFSNPASTDLGNKTIKNSINPIEKNNASDLEFIIKDAILQWLSSAHGKEFIRTTIVKIIENKINIPVDYIKQTLNAKLSDEAILKMFRDVLKSNL